MNMFLKKIANIVFALCIIFINNGIQTEAAPIPQKIPAGIIETSNEFGLWQDIYNSQQKVVVYSYMNGSTCPYQSQEFHNKISSAATSSGGKYRARPTGPDKFEKELNTAIKKLEAQTKKVKTQAEANKINKKIQAFNKLVKFTNQCTIKACIINPSKGEYILMNRKSAEAIQTMKQY